MVKNLPANAGDSGSVPGSERSPGEGNSCLENPMDRGAWWAAALGITNDLGIKQQQQLLGISQLFGCSVVSDFL